MMSLEIKFSITILAIISSVTAGVIYKMHVDYAKLHNKINNIELEMECKFASLEESVYISKAVREKENIIVEHENIIVGHKNIKVEHENIIVEHENIIVEGEEEGEEEKEEDEDEDECELLDECYDSIPLNNVKKTISFKSWLFK